jgi:hypothetical protein
MPVEPQIVLEITQFLASSPPAEQIVAFHPSPQAAERAYALIEAERNETITAEERAELDTCVFVERMMRLIKAQAYSNLKQQAS